ncbi:MAG: twin-arginine translocation signal domain-containing protein [Chloroflexi bacterium]|nr:twin-arginine translocation signal domain-containing protein [Chloroflexota bacterium]
MNRRDFLRFAGAGFAVGAVALVAACQPSTPASSGSASSADAPTAAPGQQSTTRGGELIIGMTAGNVPIPNTPPDQGGEGSRFVGYNIYNALTQLNVEQGDTSPVPSPALATRWSVGPDKLTWTFNLRPGVKFHDGTALDAGAVEFQFNRIMNKNFQYYDPVSAGALASNVLSIDTFRAVDDATFEIKTKYPDSFIPWEMMIMIPSPSAIKQYGNQDYVNHASGTGPFIMSKYIDGQVMELTPNPEYYDGPPKIDKITLFPMPEPNTRLSALNSGQVNWAEVPPPDSVDQLKANNFQVLLKQYPHAIILALNCTIEPFNNPMVRQALQYAIDKDSMCNSLLNHCGTPAYQWMYPGHPWFNQELGQRYTYDPTKAKQMLAQAGYGSGLSITIPYPSSGSGNMWPPPMMELIQQNFKAIGIEMTTVPMEWLTIVSMYRAGFGSPDNAKYHGMYFSPNTASPANMLNFTQGRIQPAGCCNVYNFADSGVDQNVAAEMAEFDQGKDDALINQGMGLVAESSPATYVCHDLNLRVLAPSVHGFVQPQAWVADFTKVTVDT